MNHINVDVKIGEVKTRGVNHILTAILGSCVGIAMFWPKRELYALAHCLLPTSNNKQTPTNGRYVDQAISFMLQELGITPSQYSQLTSVIAGGGNMTKSKETPKQQLIGYLNSQAAITLLNKQKIHIIHQDIGGMLGRKISIDCSTGNFKIKALPRTIEA